MLFLAQNAHAAEHTDPQSQMIAIAGEARQLKSANPPGDKGKATALIEKVKKIDLGEKPSAQQEVMKLSLLAELQTLNGDYDLSNDNYRKAYSLLPNFAFYRNMVRNMRLKGDQVQAKALVEEFRKLVARDLPGVENSSRRQDLIQYVEAALNEELPERKTDKPGAGDGKS